MEINLNPFFLQFSMKGKNLVKDIDKIWQNYFKGMENGNGQYYRNQLIEFYLPLVLKSAELLSSKLPKSEQIGDLNSYGIFGLMDAIEKYNSNKNVKFETYAYKKIRGAMLDGLRRMDWVPRLVRQRNHQKNKATSRFIQEYRHIPNNDELIRYIAKNFYHPDFKSDNLFRKTKKNAPFNVKKQRAKQMLEDTEVIKKLSLDLDSTEENSSLDIKLASSPNPLTEVQKRDLKDYLTTGLARDEKLIVSLYYYEELNMREIGKVLDLSESRVSQIHFKIIERLKTKLQKSRTKHEVNLEFMLG